MIDFNRTKTDAELRAEKLRREIDWQVLEQEKLRDILRNTVPRKYSPKRKA